LGEKLQAIRAFIDSTMSQWHVAGLSVAVVKDNDILMLQATRVTNRKAIELAIDVVGEMQKKEIGRYLKKQKLYNGTKF